MPAIHGVVRWRLMDLVRWLREEHGVAVSVQTLSRELRAARCALLVCASCQPGPSTMRRSRRNKRFLEGLRRLSGDYPGTAAEHHDRDLVG